ncbi:MAG TPA: glycosyltransferase family 4 protein, partial [Actinobacteria bacterium]|nr:glycosyltransferase family 4 protein [Actinomycetota bacterium]
EKSVCIGSFQKDGDGWKKGMSPKIIKGPDIFCDAVIKLSKEYPIFVLLTGPARGYVKKRLSENSVPFKHIFIKNFNKIPQYYKGIDYYFITSRAEGGPKALMESFISGVPLVSTRIGMIKDYCIDKENAMICPSESVNCLVDKFKEVHENKYLRQKIIENGFETVKELDWKVVIKSYYEKIYSKYFY